MRASGHIWPVGSPLLFLPRTAPAWWATLQCSNCAQRPDWGMYRPGSLDAGPSVVEIYCHEHLPGDYREEAKKMLMEPEEAP